MNTVFVDSVWVANKVSFDLHTIENRQYVAYYNKDRMMTLASRELGSKNWEKEVLPSTLHWDSHNYVVIDFDKEGFIHVSGNMHADPLVYFKSENTYDIYSLRKEITKGASFEFLKLTEKGNLAVDWSTEKGESGIYIIDSKTFNSVDEQILVKPKYIAEIHQRITDDPSLSDNLQEGKTKSQDQETKYILKWESRGKSHGRHAPEIIPKGPLSALFVLEIE